MLMTACQEVSSNQACGVLFQYSKSFEQQAAIEYTNLPPKSKKLIDDYKVTRDTIRNCESN